MASPLAFLALADYIGPCYFRVEMSPAAMKIYSKDFPFELGKAYAVKDGKDAPSSPPVI
jgi:transketolase C-terminal domain/subunit